MEFQKNIPPPKTFGSDVIRWRFMEVGDSILAPVAWNLSETRNACTGAGRRLGRVFKANREDSRIRIWRIE